jgi:hypothetical protein
MCLRFLNKAFIILLLFCTTEVDAVCYSTGNGYWHIAGTWSCTGSPAAVGCGQTIYISVGHVITVNQQLNYNSCAAPMHIVVSGTLQFTNGNKLDLPCGSTVEILAGGVVKKATAGGGNSTLVSICDYTWWNAGDYDQTGYQLWGGSPLPVELTKFNAFSDKNKVFLSWTTATEVNNELFELQRGPSNDNWKSVVSVPGAGFSANENEYFYTDYPEVEGVVYYRLFQKDYNGLSELIGVVSVAIDQADWSVFPNPTENWWNFIPDESLVNHRFEIHDKIGKSVQAKVLNSGSLISIGLYNHQPGLYFLSVFNELGTPIFSSKLIAK